MSSKKRLSINADEALMSDSDKVPNTNGNAYYCLLVKGRLGGSLSFVPVVVLSSASRRVSSAWALFLLLRR